MKQIVFFLQTNNPISSDQKIFITLAKYLSSFKTEQTFYVNNYFEEDNKFFENSSLTFIEAKDFDSKLFSNETVFFTPVNYLANLLCKISNLENAKICLLSYAVESVMWLANNVGDINAKDSILKLIIDSGSCAFSNYKNIFLKNEKLDYSDEIFIPKSLDCPVKEEFTSQSLVREEEINIAYYGEINNTSINTIENIISNLILLNLSERINISLIGKIKNYNISARFSAASPKIARLILTGPIEKQELETYIREEVDIVFANDENAIEVAQFGIPVVVPTINPAPFVGNNFTWLFGINQFVYRWDKDSIQSLNNDIFTLKRILESVYEKGEKKQLAMKCIEYVKASASLEFCREQLMKLVKRSTLTVAECLAQSVIKDCVWEFQKISNSYDIDFNAYLQYRKNGYKDELEKKKQDELHKKSKEYLTIQKNFSDKIEIIRKRKKIKVGFIVVFKSTFPTRLVFELMCKSTLFEPYIIVVPNVSRSKQYQDEVFNDTYSTLKREYKDRVISGFNKEKNEFLDIKNEYQILFFSNPYNILVHKNHDISHFLGMNILPIYANYGFAAITYWKEVINTDFYNYLWKVSIENTDNMEYLGNNQVIKGINGIVTGYLKMDKLAEEPTDAHKRTTIMICPHHTVTGWKKLDISNFLKYFELFIQLPKQYPDIDFIFRPHPLLFQNLSDHKIWTKQQIEEYINKINSLPNMVYDTSENYFDKFANSDAMIHDCGSFIAEYLYTKKPCCYMMKTKEMTYEGLVPFGKKCMDNHYQAYSEEDITRFIDDVVVAGKDKMKKAREEFVEKELKVNYPNASRFFVDYIAKQLRRRNHIKD